MEKFNLAVSCDSYKSSHFLQFPPNMKQAEYYLSARVPDMKTRLFGLQAIIKKYFMSVPTMAQIDEAAELWEAHGEPFHYEGWKEINELGFLPLRIKSLPEGLVVPGDIPLVTTTNTTDTSGWLPGWIETLLMQVWYPTTVCTKSYDFRVEIMKWLELSGSPEAIDFKLHDFGYRGATGNESAGIGGSACLVNFMGTDTFAAILELRRYYQSQMAGFSIPAAEHSTITSWGRDFEEDAYENMLTQFAKEGKMVAVVSDSYDLENAIRKYWGGSLRKMILDSNACIVIRPDSGEPDVVTLKSLELLEKSFGTTLNDKKYKVLHPSVRLIQGDGIGSKYDVRKIYKLITDNGFSADNVGFGSGGGLLQKLDRDTYKFAMKMSAVRIGDEWRDVYKCPVDAPWKASKKGILGVSSDFKTIDTRTYKGDNIMRTVFEDGQLLIDDSLDVIRSRA